MSRIAWFESRIASDSKSLANRSARFETASETGIGGVKTYRTLGGGNAGGGGLAPKVAP